ncbi:hypothetical protein AMJ57_02480 [Parcubacteria bacterium SG8_24]|nr:MAG: hypothetical protein AMJ57_02480 [Parcubacteria bacterium SG8_24]
MHLIILILLLPLGPLAFGASVLSLLQGGHESLADVSLVFLVLFGLLTVLFFGRFGRRAPPRFAGNAALGLGGAAAALMLLTLLAAPAYILFFGQALVVTCLAAILMLLIEGLMFFVIG